MRDVGVSVTVMYVPRVELQIPLYTRQSNNGYTKTSLLPKVRRTKTTFSLPLFDSLWYTYQNFRSFSFPFSLVIVVCRQSQLLFTGMLAQACHILCLLCLVLPCLTSTVKGCLPLSSSAMLWHILSCLGCLSCPWGHFHASSLTNSILSCPGLSKEHVLSQQQSCIVPTVPLRLYFNLSCSVYVPSCLLYPACILVFFSQCLFFSLTCSYKPVLLLCKVPSCLFLSCLHSCPFLLVPFFSLSAVFRQALYEPVLLFCKVPTCLFLSCRPQSPPVITTVQLGAWDQSHLFPVLPVPQILSDVNDTSKNTKKFERASMGHSGARGKLIHEKKPEDENLVSDSLYCI